MGSAAAWDHDVGVIGGGPGGSTAARTLARRGHRVLLLERELFPRFHIGESLLPWNDEIFRSLGIEDAIRAAGFTKKWGASFATADLSGDQYADFSAAVEVPQPQAWQVPRARFDELLLDQAAQAGVVVLQGARAQDVSFAPDGVTLSYLDPGGTARTARVGAVVDASGRAGFLAKRLASRQMDPVLRNIAVHAQYVGVPRLEGRRAGDIRMFTREDLGWIWMIPISEEVMSVGVVLPQERYKETHRATAEAALEAYLAEAPGAMALLTDAKRITEARFDADYSYLSDRHAGDRWVLVGDAGAFLDPIFSTGVLLAMQSGIEAANVISQGLADGDLSRRRFAGYEKRLERRYRHFRRFAVGFYDPAFRKLFFATKPRIGTFEAVLSILAGNWRPSLATRLHIGFFFLLIRLHRLRRRRSAMGVAS